MRNNSPLLCRQTYMTVSEQKIIGSILKKFVLIGQGKDCDNRQLMEVADQIKPHGTSKLAFDGTKARREPDGSFVHRGCTKQKGPT